MQRNKNIVRPALAGPVQSNWQHKLSPRRFEPVVGFKPWCEAASFPEPAFTHDGNLIIWHHLSWWWRHAMTAHLFFMSQ